jgi:hypothetical protein
MYRPRIERAVNAAHLIGNIPISSTSVLEIGSASDLLSKRFLRRNPAAKWYKKETIPNDSVEKYNVIVFRYSWYESTGAIPGYESLSSLLVDRGLVIFEYCNLAYWQDLFLTLGTNPPELKQHTPGLKIPVFIDEVMRGVSESGFIILRAQAIKVNLPNPISAMIDSVCRMEIFGKKLDEDLVKTRLSEQGYVLAARLATLPGSSERDCRRHVRLTIAVLAMAPTFADVRTKLPLAAFASVPDVEVIYIEKQGSLPSIPIGQPKVLIVQRQLPESDDAWKSVVEKLHEKGWAVIAEWDDHPDLFARPIREKFDKFPWASVRFSDAVQTSTEALAAEIQKVASVDVAVFDNRLLELPDYVVKPKGKNVRIFIGGLNRTIELLTVAAQLNELIAKGHCFELTVLQDRSVYEAIHTSQKEFFPSLKYDEYHNVLSRCHIALMPLSESLGNRCKSDLKWVECAGHGIACVGSNTVYGETIRHGIDGLVAHSIDDFGSHVLSLLTNPDLMYRIGFEARQRVANSRLLCQVIEQRLEWYSSVWNRVFRTE